MKYLIILSLLMTVNSHAQQQESVKKEVASSNQKRPSWSQGLPERRSAVSPSASMNKFKVNKQPLNSAEDDRSIALAERPNVGINLAITHPIVELEIESVKAVGTTRKEAFEQYHSSDKVAGNGSQVNPLIAEYKWTPIKTTPIDVPEDFDENKTLKLNIYINPKGEVTRVTVADTAISKRVFKNAQKSILKWKFQAPSKIGITETISKTFTIDINTET